ncbi:MAG: hypothetical protein NUV42_00815 [Candidatus Yonathbacteria bacterium]|nr:hypothetical protein [Candidatus Yonathbacteria bacterium]
MKKFIIGGVIVIALLVGSSYFSRSLSGGDGNSDVIAQKGIHWHPKLEIYVKGELQQIPDSIGLGAVHQPIHTHSEDAAQGVLHLEFGGRVTKDDLKLSNFFRNWGKDMNEFGSTMAMTVSGKDNTEFGDYVMADKDKIVVRFE